MVVKLSIGYSYRCRSINFAALVRVRNKIRCHDARIAFAMPPRIGTNSITVMRGGIVRTMRASRHREFKEEMAKST